MKLKNFESDVEPVIVERGLDYFASGAVEDLAEDMPGSWSAVVIGSEEYDVSVEFENDYVISWECDCPYEYGLMCKHVAATLFAIRDEIKGGMTSDKNKKVKHDTNSKSSKKTKTSPESIIDRLSEIELRNFVKSQLAENEELRNAFTIAYSHYLEGDPVEKYRNILKSIVNKASGRHGFIEYKNTYKVSDPMFDLISRSKQFLATNNLYDSLAITKVIIEELPEILQMIDDSDGFGYQFIQDAFDILDQISTEAPPLLKDELFNYFIEEMPKDKYREFAWDTHFLDLIPQTISTIEQEKLFFNLIDRNIELAKNNEYGQYGIIRLLEAKIHYLENSGHAEQAADIMSENIDIPEFRIKLIDKAMMEIDLIQARQLCENGIWQSETHRKYQNSGLRFKEIMLDISEKENNTAEIRKWAETLFFEESFNMDYFRKLKKSCSPAEWPEKAEEIINKIKKPEATGDHYHAQALADIFVEEDYPERLLTLMKINATHLSFIDRYSKHLENIYPSEMIAIYEKNITDLADQTGRSVYENVARYLIKVRKIKDGETTVKKLVQNFRHQYKNRRAMMEVLNKHFPYDE
ncbi:MAG: hypothetical protein M0Q51_10755 [Bacteroidales bacterium]|nr:hypothetical protein [Bacteroidales bacterium]